MCPISLQFFSTCWSVSWDDAHQILFSLDKNSLSESIYNGPHPNCTVQLRYKVQVNFRFYAVSFIGSQINNFGLKSMKLLAQGSNKHTKKLQGAVTPRRAAINTDTPITFTCGYCIYIYRYIYRYIEIYIYL